LADPCCECKNHLLSPSSSLPSSLSSSSAVLVVVVVVVVAVAVTVVSSSSSAVLVSAGAMFSIPNFGGTDGVGETLLREAASSNNPVARFNFFTRRTEEEEALLLTGLGAIDPDTLGDKKKNFLDVRRFAQVATLELAHSELQTEQRALLAGSTAATGRAMPSATLEIELERLQLVRSNAALTAAAAAAVPVVPPPVLQNVPPHDSDAQYLLIQERAASIARGARSPSAPDVSVVRAIRVAAAAAESLTRARAQGTCRRQKMIIAQLHLSLLATVESVRLRNPAVSDELCRLATEEFAKAENDVEVSIPDAFNRARVNTAVSAVSAASLATPVTPPLWSKQKNKRQQRSNGSFQDRSSGGNNPYNNDKKRSTEGGGGGSGKKQRKGDHDR
jgi:hypothetical protein